MEHVAVLEHGVEATADILSHGYADYVRPVHITLPGLVQMVAHDSLDLMASRVLLVHGQAAGVALIARRGWSCRLAALALLPEERGKGAGRWLMERVMEEARARGERRMVLEVVIGNEPAVALYRGLGFRDVRRLISWQLETAVGVPADDLTEVDPRLVAEMVTSFGLSNLPWQVSGESLALLGPPNRAFRLDDACAMISDPQQPHIGIRALIVAPAKRRKGQATRLLQGLWGRFPGKNWSVPALFPEEMAVFFQHLGFQQGELAQHQMETDLTG